jgi:TRAP-type mannitol/chloroaromatic compound transport system permease large subunit
VAAVLGSIIAGIAAPSEAAAMGALGSIVVAAIGRRLSFSVLRETVQATTRITAMVLFILICAQVFSLAFRGLQGERLVQDAFSLLPGGTNAQIWFLMALIFVLGFFIEWIEISYIAVPLFLPIFINAGTDLVWLSTLICINLQTSFLTPVRAGVVLLRPRDRYVAAEGDRLVKRNGSGRSSDERLDPRG